MVIRSVTLTKRKKKTIIVFFFLLNKQLFCRENKGFKCHKCSLTVFQSLLPMTSCPFFCFGGGKSNVPFSSVCIYSQIVTFRKIISKNMFCLNLLIIFQRIKLNKVAQVART